MTMTVAPIRPALADPTGDTGRMPDRFRRDPTGRDARDADDLQLVDASLVERNAIKLDRVKDDLGDMRVAMTSLAGDVRTLVERQGRHEADHADTGAAQAFTAQDIERRLRALERRAYAIPGLSAIVAVAGLVVAVWTATKG